LILRTNQIRKEAGIAMAQALKTNSTLTFLDLSNSLIAGAGEKLMAEALKYNLTLTDLNVDETFGSHKVKDKMNFIVDRNKKLSLTLFAFLFPILSEPLMFQKSSSKRDRSITLSCPSSDPSPKQSRLI
jgi:hypothetical protein